MDRTLHNKTVALGVTGGIAAYKSAVLAGLLVKLGADVHVIMTDNAAEFITPLTFSTLTGNRCVTSTFDRNFKWEVEHVSLARKAHALVIAPATANVIAKLACGIADDMLTTTALAMPAALPRIIAPAMNTGMLENPATARNLAVLTGDGYTVLDTGCGLLACGDIGKGRMAEPETIREHVEAAIARDKDLSGRKLLIKSPQITRLPKI